MTGEPSFDAFWSIFVIAIALGSYVYGWFSHPKFRKNCNECQAVQRREVELQKELDHDVVHKGYGFKLGAPDVVDCDDPTCTRNRINRS
jgi:hypothetical protein